jgi:transcriptional regulator with XRE-family HTH domain
MKERMRTALTDRYELLRRLLVDERRKVGLKQTDVAARLGRPQSYVSKIERGERGVDVIEFLEIAKAIGFNPHTMLRKLG